MVKILSFICLSFLLIFALAGCSNDKPPAQGNTSLTSGESTQPAGGNGEAEFKSTNSPSETAASEGAESRSTDNQQGMSTGKPSTKGVTKVKIFLIGIEDNGKSGKKLGTGDSIIAVDVLIEPTMAPLTAAINKLLSIKEQYYGQSGLYNPLYNSNLKLDKATIKDGEADIRLSGNLSLGGEMDDPRVKAQLEETVLQFSTVTKASVYINNKKLDDALSLKGE